jgi:hypothetical protein
MRKNLLAICAGIAVLAVPAGAASLSRSQDPAKETSGQVALPRLPQVSTNITQSTSNTITTANSVSCNNTGLHTDNSYYRGFTLSGFPALTLPQYAIQQVTIGVEQATSTSANQPITLRTWKAPVNPIGGFANPGNAVSPVSTDAITVTPQSLTLLPMTVATPPVFLVASEILAVEVFTPDGTTTGNSFFIGSNTAGESAPSYLKAAGCGVTTITTTTAIGFPGMQIVMTVTGNTQTPVELQNFSVE